MWLVFLPAPFLIAKIGEVVGAPISGRVVLGAIVIFAVVFPPAALFGWGVKDPATALGTRWSCRGILIYVAFTVYMHTTSPLLRIQKFANWTTCSRIDRRLPLPPSLWHWDGLVRTGRGVYRTAYDLARQAVNDGELLALEYHYLPPTHPRDSYIELPSCARVQKVLWFSRFPVTALPQGRRC